MPIEVDGEDRLVLIRGVRSEGYLVHDQVRISHGHAPRNGRNELLIGKLTVQTIGYDTQEEVIGKTVVLDEDEYTITGVLEADGGIIEGALSARYHGKDGVNVRRDEDPDGSLIYTLEMLE